MSFVLHETHSLRPGARFSKLISKTFGCHNFFSILRRQRFQIVNSHNHFFLTGRWHFHKEPLGPEELSAGLSRNGT